MNIKEFIKNYVPFKSIKDVMPWWLKVGSKMIIYRLPIGDKFWKSIGFFQYDQMEVPEYAYQAFKEHFDRVSQEKQLESGFSSLELGPGNSLFSAQICRSYGGDKTYLIDVDDFAIEKPESYVAMTDYLAQQGLSAPEIQPDQSFAEIMADCGGTYLTSGLASLQTIEDHSVDFVWSHAVLEHVRRAEFLEIMKETRRVISNNGVCSHTVDLKDHLDQSLNNLRFEENFWESKFVNDSGIYTNRIRCAEMLDIFREAGFEVEKVEYERWQELPVPRRDLAKQFQNWSDEELRIS
ncbi:MAG: methyltransferase domain-containing protein, partial [Cyanobacteria bacterium J06600_6]